MKTDSSTIHFQFCILGPLHPELNFVIHKNTPNLFKTRPLVNKPIQYYRTASIYSPVSRVHLQNNNREALLCMYKTSVYEYKNENLNKAKINSYLVDIIKYGYPHLHKNAS